MAHAAMHLAPLHPDDKPSPLSQKDWFLASFPGEPIEPKQRRRRWAVSLPTWDQVDTVIWAAVPLLFHILPIVFLAVALFSQTPKRSYFFLKEKNGTGRLDYYILNACVTPSNSSTITCLPRSLHVNFVPAITPILPALPGMSSLKLPVVSDQTPSIFVATLVILFAAFLLYLPLWILAYYPYAPLPPPMVRFYRYYARKLYQAVAALAFVGFILATTIGVGYKLFMMGYRDDFSLYYRYGTYATGSNVLAWEAHLGDGYDLVWAAATWAGLTVIAMNIALHNGMDERVDPEWTGAGRR
ncbi:hypothetical protein JCM10213_007621 [Rhodosporidiobolus nylandii]